MERKKFVTYIYDNPELEKFTWPDVLCCKPNVGEVLELISYPVTYDPTMGFPTATITKIIHCFYQGEPALKLRIL